jgi:release factor glutamine methyltransferase
MDETIGDLLTWGKETLKKEGLDDFDISAELLLRTILGISRSELLLNLTESISSQKSDEYKNLIAKRAAHVPLQYLTGRVEFYNIELIADNRALIPRPETEILIETVLKKLKPEESIKILDIGTGTGNIAIAFAKNLPGARLTAIDISPDALELAKSNAQLNYVEERVSFIHGNILDGQFIKTLGLFDCVVSNPPYVASDEKEKLQPEVSQYEPGVAIFAGDDPLIFFKTIAGNISYILHTGGLLAFEIGLGQAEAISDFIRSDFKDTAITRDLAGHERIITGIYAGTNKR